MGAGVLSLPFAFYAAGWAGGLLATATVASIEAFTLYVLARYAEVTGSATYSGLVSALLPGDAGSLAGRWALDARLLAAAVAPCAATQLRTLEVGRRPV